MKFAKPKRGVPRKHRNRPEQKTGPDGLYGYVVPLKGKIVPCGGCRGKLDPDGWAYVAPAGDSWIYMCSLCWERAGLELVSKPKVIR